MAHVFISYKSDDHEFAFELNRQIKDAGLPTWIDKEWLRAGEDWREDIDEAIRQAFALVLVMTQEAVNSKYVMYEFASAWALGIKVIPIILKDILPKDFHPRLEGVQGEDFRTQYPWGKLFGRLQELRTEHLSRDAVEQARKLLTNPNPQERRKGIEALEHMGAINPLADAIQKSPYPDVRMQGAFVLANVTAYEDKRAIPGLVEALMSNVVGKQDEIITNAAKALSSYGNFALQKLIEATTHNDYKVRVASIEAIGLIGNSLAIPTLSKALKDENNSVRERAILAFGKMINDAPIEELTNALSDQFWMVRCDAAKILGTKGDKAAIPHLEKLLDDEQFWVRLAAVTALEDIGSVEVVHGLVTALKDQENKVRDTAFAALNKLGDIAIPELLSALYHENENIRLSSIHLLRAIGNSSHSMKLLEMLRAEKSQEILQAVEKTIDAIVDATNIPLLIGTSYNEDIYTRWVSIKALGIIGHPSASHRLVETLYDEVMDIQEISAWALGKIHSREAIPKLLERLEGAGFELQLTVIDALGEIGDPSSIEELIPYLSRSQLPMVTRATVTALKNIGTPEALQAVKEWQEKQNSQ